jgi:hypothetical protein
MNIESWLARAAASLAFAATCAGVAAQQTPAVGGPGGPGAARGPGYHDPRSAFKPLEEREDVLSWKQLAAVTLKVERSRVIPTFPPAIAALDGKRVKVQGFMMPLEAGEKQRHFLLSAVPTTCGFCIPAGPEGLIEVRMRDAVAFGVDALLLEGRLAVLRDDKYGLLYRITEAVAAP